MRPTEQSISNCASELGPQLRCRPWQPSSGPSYPRRLHIWFLKRNPRAPVAQNHDHKESAIEAGKRDDRLQSAPRTVIINAKRKADNEPAQPRTHSNRTRPRVFLPQWSRRPWRRCRNLDGGMQNTIQTTSLLNHCSARSTSMPKGCYASAAARQVISQLDSTRRRLRETDCDLETSRARTRQTGFPHKHSLTDATRDSHATQTLVVTDDGDGDDLTDILRREALQDFGLLSQRAHRTIAVSLG